jgi:hypothetical protein
MPQLAPVAVASLEVERERHGVTAAELLDRRVGERMPGARR